MAFGTGEGRGAVCLRDRLSVLFKLFMSHLFERHVSSSEWYRGIFWVCTSLSIKPVWSGTSLAISHICVQQRAI